MVELLLENIMVTYTIGENLILRLDSTKQISTALKWPKTKAYTFELYDKLDRLRSKVTKVQSIWNFGALELAVSGKNMAEKVKLTIEYEKWLYVRFYYKGCVFRYHYFRFVSRHEETQVRSRSRL